MSKRTIGLIIALFVIAVVLLAISLSSNIQQKNKVTTETAPSPTPYAQSTLSFQPSTLTIPLGTTKQQTVNIMLTTGADDVTGVQLELSYDPRVLSNVDIQNGTMFQKPNIIFKKINQKAGTISYVYGITQSQSSQKGSGLVGVLTFTPNTSALDQNGQAINQTTIRLLPKSEVASRGMDYSVLTTASLSNRVQILFSASTPGTAQQ